MKKKLFFGLFFMLCIGETSLAKKSVGKNHLIPSVNVSSTQWFPLLVIDYFIQYAEKMCLDDVIPSFKNTEELETIKPTEDVENDLLALIPEEKNVLVSLIPEFKNEIEDFLDSISLCAAKKIFLKSSALPKFIKDCCDHQKIQQKHFQNNILLLEEEAPRELEIDTKIQKTMEKHIKVCFSSLKKKIKKQIPPEIAALYSEIDYDSILSQWMKQRPPSFVKKYEDMNDETPLFLKKLYEGKDQTEHSIEHPTPLEYVLEMYMEKMNQYPYGIEMEKLDKDGVYLRELMFTDSVIRVCCEKTEDPHKIIISVENIPHKPLPGGMNMVIRAEHKRKNPAQIPSFVPVASDQFFPLFVVDYLRKTLQEIDLNQWFSPEQSVTSLEPLLSEEHLKNKLLSLTEREQRALILLLPDKKQDIEKLIQDISMVQDMKIKLGNDFLTFIKDYLDTLEIKMEHLQNSALLLEEEAKIKLKIYLESLKIVEKHITKKLSALRKDMELHLPQTTLTAYSQLNYESALSTWVEQRTSSFKKASQKEKPQD